MAAVSARRIVCPSDAAIHPESRNQPSSSSVHPPSGPIASTASLLVGGRTSRNRVFTSDSASTIRGIPSATPPLRAKFPQLDWSSNLRRCHAPRLLSRLPRQALPAFVPLRRGRSEMSVSPLRNDRNNARHSDLSTLLDRPFHAIELEDGKNQRQIGGGPRRHFFPKRKFNAIVRDRNDCPAPDNVAASDIKLLSDLEPAARGSRCKACSPVSAAIFPWKVIGDPAASSQ